MLREASTGASDDLASATGLATRMVREWGLSPEVGPVGYAEGSAQDNPFAARPYAEQTQRTSDQEVTRLVREAEATAMSLLATHRDALDRVIALLLDRETIDGDELAAAAAGAAPHPHDRPWNLPALVLPPTPAYTSPVDATAGNGHVPFEPEDAR